MAIRSALARIRRLKVFQKKNVAVLAFLCILIIYLLSSTVLLSYRDATAPLYRSANPGQYEIQSFIELDYSDVTYVTHLTLDRVAALERTMSLWDGPVVVAFFLKNPKEDSANLEAFRRRNANRDNLAFSTYQSSEKISYPVNVLRNQALRLVKTNLAFLADVDFIPSANLYSYVKVNIRRLNVLSRDHVFVVPAFEHHSLDANFPVTKEQVCVVALARCDVLTTGGDAAPVELECEHHGAYVLEQPESPFGTRAERPL